MGTGSRRCLSPPFALVCIGERSSPNHITSRPIVSDPDEGFLFYLEHQKPAEGLVPMRVRTTHHESTRTRDDDEGEGAT